MYFLVSLARIREITESDIEVLPGETRVTVMLRHQEGPASGDAVEREMAVEVIGKRHRDMVGFDLDKPEYRVRADGRIVASEDLPSEEFSYYVEEALHLLDALVELRAPDRRT